MITPNQNTPRIRKTIRTNLPNHQHKASLYLSDCVYFTRLCFKLNERVVACLDFGQTRRIHTHTHTNTSIIKHRITGPNAVHQPIHYVCHLLSIASNTKLASPAVGRTLLHRDAQTTMAACRVTPLLDTLHRRKLFSIQQDTPNPPSHKRSGAKQLCQTASHPNQTTSEFFCGNLNWLEDNNKKKQNQQKEN